ncbi:hypothetical protein GAPWKB11_0081 [Gilliamella apicola]|nr:hypothetical protein GAPWKB11_0081 [Gilliamella apicola]
MFARANQKFTIGKYQLINFHNDIIVPLMNELTLRKGPYVQL